MGLSSNLIHETANVRGGSDGMTLRGLRKDAKDTATWRGHDMGRFDRFGVSTCHKCEAWVQVDAKPAPNGIDIGGPAVAIGCENYPYWKDHTTNLRS